MNSPLYTMGIDIGSNFIKLVLMDYNFPLSEGEGLGVRFQPVLLDKQTEKIRN